MDASAVQEGAGGKRVRKEMKYTVPEILLTRFVRPLYISLHEIVDQ
jgi:hypothetical protein